MEITGGAHSSMLTAENPEQIVNIAPAEGQEPLFIMTDPSLSSCVIPTSFAMVRVVLVK